MSEGGFNASMETDQHARDLFWMGRAIELAGRCPASDTAYSVGAVIVDADDQEMAFGYSREGDPFVHAEESALAKLARHDPGLRSATIYSTLEPCSQRASRPITCTQHILDAQLPRVVIAWLEPSLFVENARGSEILRQAGVQVDEIPALAEKAKAPNAHLDLS